MTTQVSNLETQIQEQARIFAAKIAEAIRASLVQQSVKSLQTRNTNVYHVREDNVNGKRVFMTTYQGNTYYASRRRDLTRRMAQRGFSEAHCY
jgi:hypothetical protein